MRLFMKILFIIGLIAMIISSMLSNLEWRSTVYMITLATWGLDVCICLILLNRIK